MEIEIRRGDRCDIKSVLDISIREPEHGKIDLMDLKPIIYAPNKYYSLKMSLGNVGISRETTTPIVT